MRMLVSDDAHQPMTWIARLKRLKGTTEANGWHDRSDLVVRLKGMDSVTRRADWRNQWHGGTTLLADNDDKGGARCVDGVCRTAIEKKVRKEEDDDFFCYLCSNFIHDKPSINHQT